MATGKLPGSRPRAGQGLASNIADTTRRVTSPKPARHRNRNQSAKPAAVARRPPRKPA